MKFLGVLGLWEWLKKDSCFIVRYVDLNPSAYTFTIIIIILISIYVSLPNKGGPYALRVWTLLLYQMQQVC